MTRKNRWVAGQAVVTVLLLGLLLRGLDLAAFRGLVEKLPAWFYFLSLAVILAGQVAYAWRWRLLLRAAGVAVPFSMIARQYFIGIFCNNFLPSTVGGDLVKVYLLGRDHGYQVVTASVVMDRVLGIGLLAVLAAVSLWALPLSSASLVAARLAVTGLAAVATMILVMTVAGTGGLPARVAPLGRRAVALAEQLQRIRLDIAAALTDAGVILQATTLVLGYFLAVTGIYLMFFRLQTGAAPAFLMVFGIVTATTVLSNIPVSLNGLGLREQLHAVLLAPLGVSPEMAVAISLLLFAHLMIASVIGFLFWLQIPALPADARAPLET